MQHGQVLHMNDVRREEEKTYGERGEIEDRFEQLEDSARQARQVKSSDDVENARIEFDAATREAG